MPEIKKASCLFCSLQCGFGMELDRGVPVRLDLDTEAPQNLGSLCVRGHYNIELLQHPKRFLGATVNRRRVPWSSGVTKVAGKIGDIKSQGGGDALGVIVSTELSNEDYDAAVAFAATALGTKNIAVAYDGNDYPLLMGGGAGDATVDDLDDGTTFILIGDVFWGHPCIAKRVIEARHKSRSNRIFTLNPFRTNTDWFADRHFAVRPGTEPLVLSEVLNELNVSGVPKVDPAKVEAATGLRARGAADIAKFLKEQHKVVILVSSRLGDSTSEYLIGLFASKLAKAVNGKYAPLFRGGNALGAFERVGSAKTVPDILNGVADRKIKGLLVFGPDIVQLYPGAVSQDDIEELDFLAASAIFENDVTKHSDVGLPQAVWTETPGSYTASFGISTTIEPLVAAQGDAKPVREMLAAVAAELGAPLREDAAKAEHPPLGVDVEAALAKIAKGGANGVSLIEAIHPLHRWDGTITGRMAFPQSVSPYCEIWVGPETAAGLGIDHGTTVALSTDRGETRLIVTVTDRMPGSLVAIPTYVPDARGLMAWTPNAGTRWYDVSADGAKVAPEK